MLHHPRSLPSSILADQLFPNTGIQAIPEPAMAGFFSSSSQIRPPLQLTSFVSRWQSARVVQRSDSRRLVFIPLGPLDWRAGSNGWKTSGLVLDIKPLEFPFDYFITKVIRDIHSILSLPKLETRAPLLHLRRIYWVAVSNEKESERVRNGARCPEKLRINARRWKYEQRNLGSDDAIGSCSSTGVQKRKKNKETPIPVPRMR